MAGRVLPAERPPRPLRGQPRADGLALPYSREGLREILRGCVGADGLRDVYVAVVCTRGVPPRGARDPRLATNRFYFYAVPFVWIAPPEKQQQGLNLHISMRVCILPESVDPTIKSCQWINLVQSLFEAYDHQRDTCVMVNTQGHLAEGPGFNVFMVRSGMVRTPRHGVLEGNSRRTVIELCERLQLPVQVGPGPMEHFRAADEVFLSSTGGGVLPIAPLDDVPLPAFPGPVTRRLLQAYWQAHQDAAWSEAVSYAVPG